MDLQNEQKQTRIKSERELKRRLGRFRVTAVIITRAPSLHPPPSNLIDAPHQQQRPLQQQQKAAGIGRLLLLLLLLLLLQCHCSTMG